MAQIVETYCEDGDGNDGGDEETAATPNLITHVAVHKMTVHDGHRLPDALDDLAERSLTPAMMLGDSHYGSSDNMALTRDRNIDLVAPLGGSMLAKHPANPALGHCKLAVDMIDADTTTCGA